MATTPAIPLGVKKLAKGSNSLASLAQQCDVTLRVNRDMMANYENGAFIGYKPTGRIIASVSGTPEAIGAMRQRLDDASAPASHRQMEVWLVELDLIAPRKASSPVEDDLRMQAYLSRLSAYPADVVHEALLTRTWRFFPSWAELKDVCDVLMKPRLAVLAELERGERNARELELRAKALPTEQTAVPTDEEAVTRRTERVRVAEELLKPLKAKVADAEALEVADAEAARASYLRFRTKAEP